MAGPEVTSEIRAHTPCGCIAALKWTYSTAEPHTIVVDTRLLSLASDELRSVGPDQPDTTWMFDRSMLHTAFTEPGLLVGIGDVQVEVDGADVVLHFLDIDDGSRCPVRQAAVWVRRFLQRTYEFVPSGAERVDVDAAITGLLRGVR